MSSHLPDPCDILMNEEIPDAIPSLIEAAVAAFDADRDVSRRYLLRASALLRAKRRSDIGGGGSSRPEPRRGLMTWQVNRLVDYIEAKLAEKMTAQELAGVINVSVGQMFRAFKVSAGVSPFQYITRRRVELACRMMSGAQESLSQIAAACGLCDQAHFCRVFRRTMGMSPTQWRRSRQVRGLDPSRITDVTSPVIGVRHSATLPHSVL
jgi:AraC family transcriptional regulator